MEFSGSDLAVLSLTAVLLMYYIRPPECENLYATPLSSIIPAPRAAPGARPAPRLAPPSAPPAPSGADAQHVSDPSDWVQHLSDALVQEGYGVAGDGGQMTAGTNTRLLQAVAEAGFSDQGSGGGEVETGAEGFGFRRGSGSPARHK
jgi:hypothetical protein